MATARRANRARFHLEISRRDARAVFAPSWRFLRIDRSTIDPYHFRPSTTVGSLLVISCPRLSRRSRWRIRITCLNSFARENATRTQTSAPPTMRGILKASRRRGRARSDAATPGVGVGSLGRSRHRSRWRRGRRRRRRQRQRRRSWRTSNSAPQIRFNERARCSAGNPIGNIAGAFWYFSTTPDCLPDRLHSADA
jgi:hypothetical protein